MVFVKNVRRCAERRPVHVRSQPYLHGRSIHIGVSEAWVSLVRRPDIDALAPCTGIQHRAVILAR